MSTNSDADPGRRARALSNRKIKILTRVGAILVLIAIAAFRPQMESWLSGPDSSRSDLESTTTEESNSASRRQESGDSISTPEAYGVLSEIRPGVFRSTAGLLYVPRGSDEHRLEHVLLHQKDDISKPIHGVFDGDQASILACIDEAFLLAKSGNRRVAETTEGSRTVYSVDLQRRIGYVGGQVGQRKNHPECRFLQLVTQDENEVVTAYPTNRP